MYLINFANKSKNLKVGTADAHGIGPGESWQSGELGDFWLSTQQFGAINFHDLGKQRVPGDTQETWGVYITYRGQQFVGRYEGGGRIDVVLNDLGQITLTGNLHIHQVYEPPVIVEDHPH
jgi:hypothetical protein